MNTVIQLKIYRRLKFIKITIAVGMCLSMLCSVNLWAGQRWFPTAPVFDSFYINPPYDYIFLVIELLFLVILMFSSKPRLIIFFILSLNLFFILFDQNRLQPWFYLYNLLLLVLFFYNWRIDNINSYHSIFIILQLCVSAVYVSSGLQKINPYFVSETYAWFIKPLSTFFSERQMATLFKTGYIAPYVEIFIGIGLLIKPIRYLTVPLCILMHVAILAFISPVGNNYNASVWPWNIIMIVLVFLLFSGITTDRFFSISHLFKMPVFYVVLVLFWIMPFLNLLNYWDSYLSFSLYSGNTNNAKILMSEKAYDKLPLYIKHYVYDESAGKVLYPKLWCMNELKSPIYPEKRIFERAVNHVRILTNTSEQDVKLVYIEKLKLFEKPD